MKKETQVETLQKLDRLEILINEFMFRVSTIIDVDTVLPILSEFKKVTEGKNFHEKFFLHTLTLSHMIHELKMSRGMELVLDSITTNNPKGGFQ